ncbi:pentalenic acid synthase [Kitasatospora sp. MAA4]|uniref:cytochrome P450 n=1 Tax=Kitasatospora sp. MAA4 TaxID=3035093 RepID=UPI0024749E15|nr:cytochrome P450 [Kitasatospora sp. MAA4]MDH6131099.1 pentalenic acid synthase [Kitasatospora sp. MAA4]
MAETNESGAPGAEDALPELPMTRTCPYQPPAEYEDLRARGPVTRVRQFDGRPVWAVTGHAETRELMSNPAMSVNRFHPNFPMPIPALTQLQTPRSAAIGALIRTDPPEHTKQRRDILPSFTLKKIAGIKPEIEQTAASLLTDMIANGDSAELLDAYVKPLVATVLSQLLGIPYEDRNYFEDLTYRRFDPAQVVDAMSDLTDYLAKLLVAKETEPGEGLLDDLVVQVKDGTLERDELVRYALVLVIAGQETTANTIALGVLTLLEHPEQLEELRAEPELWRNAVEELLRFLSLTGGLSRVATEDITIGDAQIRADDGIIFLNPAANRDEAQFERPNELDIHRNVRNHLSFGFGIHQCIGQNLARVELDVALRTLFEKVPDLRLAVPMQEIPVKQGLVFGLAELPVEW